MLNFFHLVISSAERSVLYSGNYNPVLVRISIVVAIFASYASLLISQYISTTLAATVSHLWFAISSLCFGAGIGLVMEKLTQANGGRIGVQSEWSKEHHFSHYAAGHPFGGGKDMRDVAYV